MGMYWITEKGIDYLTKIIDQPTKISGVRNRYLDILGELEYRGGGLSAGQVVSYLEARDIEAPLTGTREQYFRAIGNLEKEGYIIDLSRG